MLVVCVPYLRRFLIVSLRHLRRDLSCTFIQFNFRYFGLVSFWIGREKNDKKWTAKGAESKISMERLASLASTWNFQNSESSLIHF